jgi:uncharacterized protein
MSYDSACDASPRVSRTARALILTIEAYRVTLSPLLGGQCRFEPSCSQYVQQALARHGAARGLWLGMRRLLRCQPFGRAGYDPVP